MGYTMSMDTSVRVHKTQVSGYLYHMFRDLYEEKGIDLHHENERIDHSRTHENVSLVYDDDTGELVRPTSIADAKAKLFKDREKVETKEKSNSVWIRPIVFQLGNGYYEDNPNGANDEHDEFDAMYEWACDTWGKERIRGVSIHYDETNPHATFFVSGITQQQAKECMRDADGEPLLNAGGKKQYIGIEDEDGNPVMQWCNNQKSIVNGKKHLASLHVSLRNHMRDRGYDVELENQEDKHPHYNDKQYKAIQDQLHEQMVSQAEENARDKAELECERREHGEALDAERADLWLERKQNARDREQLDADRQQFEVRVSAEVKRREQIRASAQSVSSSVRSQAPTRRLPEMGY